MNIKAYKYQDINGNAITPSGIFPGKLDVETIKIGNVINSDTPGCYGVIIAVAFSNDIEVEPLVLTVIQ